MVCDLVRRKTAAVRCVKVFSHNIVHVLNANAQSKGCWSIDTQVSRKTGFIVFVVFHCTCSNTLRQTSKLQQPIDKAKLSREGSRIRVAETKSNGELRQRAFSSERDERRRFRVRIAAIYDVSYIGNAPANRE